MTDYHDGPRVGIASFRGKPHVYSRPFDHSKNDYADLYELLPVDEETLRLALEREIWLRWDHAYTVGDVGLGTYPLPSDRSRHHEIAPVMEARLAALPGPSIRANGIFRPTPGQARRSLAGSAMECCRVTTPNSNS
jgi:hypothetical protein